MTILHIFKENDNLHSNELTRLRDGSHYVGRDTPINYKDKRISRKHAVIIVHRNGAVIQSAHINPTFFKSSIGDTIQILKENDMLVLNNGDRFALLEDADWFKVKITFEDYEYDDANVISFNSINNKRTTEEEYPEINKRIKIEPENTPEVDISTSNINTVSKNVLNILPNIENSVQITADDINRSGVDITYLDNNSDTENSNLDQLNISLGRPHVDNTVPGNSNINTGRPNVADTLPNSSNINIDRSIVDSTQPDRSNVNESKPNLNDTLPLSDRDTERPDLDTTFPINSDKNLEHHPHQPTGNISICNLPHIKIEPPDNIKTEPLDETSFNAGIIASSSTGSSSTTKVKIEPTVKEPPGTAENQPSSSSNSNPLGDPNLRRDRCWYGKDCYRKNHLHKQDFSHPGDTDYDSDPNDIRPVCPFGVHCYRRNILHRRQFRHFSRPAPRPPNINLNVHVNNCPCCNPQNRPRKPGYESDPDY